MQCGSLGTASISYGKTIIRNKLKISSYTKSTRELYFKWNALYINAVLDSMYYAEYISCLMSYTVVRTGF